MKPNYTVLVEFKGLDKITQPIRKISEELNRLSRALNRFAKTVTNNQKIVEKFEEVGDSVKKATQNTEKLDRNVKKFIRTTDSVSKATQEIKRFNNIVKETARLQITPINPNTIQEIRTLSKATKEQLRILRDSVYSELKAIQGDIYNVNSVHLLKLRRKINEYKKELEKAFKTGRISVYEYRRELAKLEDSYGRLADTIKRKENIIWSWWKRFGAVAIGFTVVYRAFNLLEEGIGALTDSIKDAISEFDELIEVQYKYAMFMQLFNKDITQNQAVEFARKSINALQIYSVGALSSIQDLKEGMDELAQHGVFLTQSTMKYYVNFADFIVMIASTVGSSAKQVRQELQSLFEGTLRAGNTTLRFIKNLLGDGFEKWKKQIQDVNTRQEALLFIMKKISDYMEKLKEQLRSKDFAYSLNVAKNSFGVLLSYAIRLASVMAGLRKDTNLFAYYFNKAFNNTFIGKFYELLRTAGKVGESVSLMKTAKGSDSYAYMAEYESSMAKFNKLWDSFVNSGAIDTIYNLSKTFEYLAKAVGWATQAMASMVTKVSELIIRFSEFYNQHKKIFSVIKDFLTFYLIIASGKKVAMTLARAFAFLWEVISPKKKILTAIAVIGTLFTAFKSVYDSIKQLGLHFKDLGVLIAKSLAVGMYKPLKGLQILIVRMLTTPIETVLYTISPAKAQAFRNAINEFLNNTAIDKTIKKWERDVGTTVIKFGKLFVANFKKNAVGMFKQIHSFVVYFNRYVNKYLSEGLDKLFPEESAFKDKQKFIKNLKDMILSIAEATKTLNFQFRKSADEIKAVVQSIDSLISAYNRLYESINKYNFTKYGVPENIRNRIIQLYEQKKAQLIQLLKADKGNRESTLVQLYQTDIEERLFKYKTSGIVKNIRQSFESIKALKDKLFAEFSKSPEQQIKVIDSFINALQRLIELGKTKTDVKIFNVEDLPKIQQYLNQLEVIREKLTNDVIIDRFNQSVAKVKQNLKEIQQLYRDKAPSEYLQGLIKDYNALERIIEVYKRKYPNVFNDEKLKNAKELMEEIKKQIIEMSDKTKGGNAFFEIFQRYRDSVYRQMELTKFWANTGTRLIADFTKQVGDVVYDFLTGNLKSFKDYLSNMTQMIMRLLADVIAELIKIQVLKAIVGGSTSGKEGETTNTSSGGGILSGIASFFSKIFHFAEGGIVTQPTVGLIGEAGYPEAVIPLKKGYVPVRISGAGVGASQNVNVVLNVNALDAKSFIEWERQTGAISGIVVDSIRKGIANNSTIRNVIRRGL